MGKTTNALNRHVSDPEIERGADMPASLVQEGTPSGASLLARSLSALPEATDTQETTPVQVESIDTDILEDDDPESIRAQIEQTRAEMSETIDAIKTRLDPHVLMQEAVDKAKDTAHDVAVEAQKKVHSVSNQVTGVVKRYPMTVAIAGAMLGWVLLRAWDKRRHRESSLCE